MVGVVLHEGRAAGQALADDLHHPQERAGLPVALGPESVAVGHQALDGEPGQLAEAVEVLEGRREALEAALFEEGAQAELDPGGLAERVVARSAAGEGRGHRVALLVLGAEPVDLGLGDSR